MRFNQFQASNPARRASKFAGVPRSWVKRQAQPAEYPEVPAMWPNRAVRRAVKHNRMSSVPGPWLAAMAQRPGLQAAIRALA